MLSLENNTEEEVRVGISPLGVLRRAATDIRLSINQPQDGQGALIPEAPSPSAQGISSSYTNVANHLNQENSAWGPANRLDQMGGMETDQPVKDKSEAEVDDVMQIVENELDKLGIPSVTAHAAAAKARGVPSSTPSAALKQSTPATTTTSSAPAVASAMNPDIVDKIVDGVSPELNQELHKIERQAQHPQMSKVDTPKQVLNAAKPNPQVATPKQVLNAAKPNPQVAGLKQNLKVAALKQNLKEAKATLAAAEKKKPQPAASLASRDFKVRRASKATPWQQDTMRDTFKGTRAMASLARREGFKDWPDAFTLPKGDARIRGDPKGAAGVRGGARTHPPAHALQKKRKVIPSDGPAPQHSKTSVPKSGGTAPRHSKANVAKPSVRGDTAQRRATPPSVGTEGTDATVEVQRLDDYSKSKMEAQVKQKIKHLPSYIVKELAEQELVHKAEASWIQAHQPLSQPHHEG